MLIAKIINNAVVEVKDYREMFPNASFPSTGPDADFLQQNFCLPVTVWKPYDRLTQKLTQVTPYIEDEMVYTVVVESLTEEEIAANTQTQWNKIRAERDQLLKTNVDPMNPMWWESLTEEQKQLFRDYRQALLDITDQADPYNITWPEYPTLT